MNDREPSAALAGRFAVSQYTTWGQTFDEDIALYERLGVDCIELCECKLSEDAPTRRQQIQRVRDAGMRVTSVQPVVHALFPDSFSPDVKDVHRRAERYQRTIEWVGEELSEEKPPLVAIGGRAPDYDFSYAHRFAREQYAVHAELAAQAGLSLAFEPLSSVYMNTDTFICTLRDAVSLVEDVGKPNFGLLLDVWHIWREFGVLAQIEALGDRIFAVHVGDWPRSEPRNQADRVIPGTGLADFAAIVKATEAAGYRGSYCLELFSHESLEDSLSRADPAWVIAESRSGLAAAFDAAASPEARAG